MRYSRQKTAAFFCFFLQMFTTVISSLLPVTLAIAEKSKPPALQFNTDTSEPYVLKEGDTVASLAKQHGISVQELERINVFRTFHTSFARLSAGDEIDVPVAGGKQGKQVGEKPEQYSEQDLYSGVSGAAQLLSSSDISGQAVSKVRSIASSAATAEVQQWLSKYGTASVQLSVDDELNLEGSSLDWLVPWYETTNFLLFTQVGARRQDARNTINLGGGLRTFQGDWMYGLNTFFDNDITGHNRRIGVGVEAWTDYLQLSGNTYLGTTGWHQSRDFADFDERPANGFDIRAQGWLPAYPQLGASLMYEQYRGQNVALFGKGTLQKDPKAMTLGINYTPFPLLNLGVSHRIGQDGAKDTSVNLGLTLRLGDSWASHITPSEVAGMRLLKDSRYNLVDRNNNIVLDYKKQILLTLTLPEKVGVEGASDSLMASVKSKYPVSRIDWDFSALEAAGGSVQVSPSNSLQLDFVYPAYDPAGNNTYKVYATAWDANGNASETVSTTLTSVSVAKSAKRILTYNIDTESMPILADGESAHSVILKLVDESGAPLSGEPVLLATNTDSSLVIISDGESRKSKASEIDSKAYPDLKNEVPGTTDENGVLKVYVKDSKPENMLLSVVFNNGTEPERTDIPLAFTAADAEYSSLVKIYRNDKALGESDALKVGDTLTAHCGSDICDISSGRLQWQVQSVPASDKYIDISGQNKAEYIVENTVQRRSLRVKWVLNEQANDTLPAIAGR